MQSSQKKRNNRIARHRRVRAQVIGVAERPRLAVYRSLTKLFAQIIDDTTGKTLCSVSTNGLKGDAGERKGKVAESYLGGLEIAKLAKAKKISSVVFDRGGFSYHGRVEAFATGAREGGLEF